MTTKIPVELSSTPSIVDNGDATAITIDSSERVGIGTSSPGTILHTRTSDATSNNNAGGGFYHTSSSTAGSRSAQIFLDADNGNFSTSSDGAYAYIEKIGGGGNLNIRNQDSSPIAFYRSSSESMRIDGSGNIGVGTTTPTSKLQVATANGTLSHFGGIATTNTHYTGISLGYSEAANANYRKTAIVQEQLADGAARGNLHFLVDTSADANSASLSDSKMMINGISGDVGINTTSPANKLDVNGTVQFSSAYGTGTALIINNTSADNNYTPIGFRDNGTTVGYIFVNGSLNQTSYVTSSDYRLKENVNYSWNATEKLKQLKPAEFNMISDEKNTVLSGFLAHEVENILPQAVNGIKDAVDEEGNPEYQGIDHSKLVPLLTKAIQEQQDIIDDLKSRIETLEG